ncbi:hypothetical protein V8E51_008319 [Hyaloscypha variabilis]
MRTKKAKTSQTQKDIMLTLQVHIVIPSFQSIALYHGEQQWVQRCGLNWGHTQTPGKEFKNMTQLVERGCYANLVEDIEEGLPIPDLIITSILENRQGALFELYGLIEQTIRRYH